MLLSNLLVEHIFLKWISVRSRMASLFVLCMLPFECGIIFTRNLILVTLKCVRFISEETCFFIRLLPICCFHFHDSSFPSVIFPPSSFQPILLLVLSYIVLSCRYYCSLEGLRNCMENENILIFCSGHTSPLEIILFLDINSFVFLHMMHFCSCAHANLVFLLRMYFVETEFECHIYFFLFQKSEFLPLPISGEQSCLKSVLQC